MSNLSEALAKGNFVVTGEIGPPKGVNVETCLEDAEHLRGKVVAINVTDIQSAVMRVGSLATCRLLLDRKLEPILQMVLDDLQVNAQGIVHLRVETQLIPCFVFHRTSPPAQPSLSAAPDYSPAPKASLSWASSSWKSALRKGTLPRCEEGCFSPLAQA